MLQRWPSIVCFVLLHVVIVTTCGAMLEVGEAASDFRLRIVSSEEDYQLYGNPGIVKLLLFLKQKQRFGQDTLKAIDAEFEAHPELNKKIQKILVYQSAEMSEELQGIMARKESPWLVLLDTDQKIHKRYDVIVTPTIYLLAKDNTITHKIAGFSPMLQSQLRAALTEISDLRPAQPLPSEMVGPEERAKAFLHFSTAAQLEEKGIYERAISQYELGLKRDPTNTTAELSLAALYLKVGKADAAKDIYQRIIQANPKGLVPRMGLANVYRAERKYDKAKEVLREILKERPDSREAHYSLGQILLLMGRKAEAQEEFKAAGVSFPAEATPTPTPEQVR